MLEDNIWDEFGASATDDHIVPPTVDEYGAQFKIQGDGRTKPQHEVIGVARNADNTAKYGDNDSLKEVTGMVSDDPMMSSQGLKTGDIDSVSSDFCAEDPVLVDNCATEDNNIYRFPLNHISCDSTFGLGSLSNEDDLCRVSSSHATERSQDVLKADAKLNSLPEHCATSGPDNVGPSTIDSYKKNVLPSDKISSLDTSGDNPGLADMSSLDVSSKESEIKDDLAPTEQVSKIFPFSKLSVPLPIDLLSRNI
ncbi:protein LNK1-like [Gossypium australe]|uniref:Protein LNK1-like n=1 Tax=Gossypium australe TaxID=47621 RepID=A0A5B6X6L2_9ROSI|nr:protein LNK1-like [Gossypium australe]